MSNFWYNAICHGIEAGIYNEEVVLKAYTKKRITKEQYDEIMNKYFKNSIKAE